MVIDNKGERLGILSTQDALRLSKEQGLDLVVVAGNVDPPVCKLMDFGKFKYELKKKTQESKKKQIVIKTKEIKLRPRTEEHDLNFKIEHIKRFLNEGNKVKVTVVMRGRELMFKQLSQDALEKVLKAVQDIGSVESKPTFEGRSYFTILAPVRRKENAKT